VDFESNETHRIDLTEPISPRFFLLLFIFVVFLVMLGLLVGFCLFVTAELALGK